MRTAVTPNLNSDKLPFFVLHNSGVKILYENEFDDLSRAAECHTEM